MATKENEHDDLLNEIRDNFAFYSEYWADNYREGDFDMDCLSAKYGPWSADEIAKREATNRPIHHLDVVSQYNKRIVNQARVNPRSIIITPKGSDATDESALLREDRLRQMDHEELAVPTRISAFQDAVDRGMGFYMVTTEFQRPDSFDQKIGMRMIPNPRSVLVDPYFKKPDFSDIRGAFVIDRFSWSAYRNRFSESGYQKYDPELLRKPGLSFNIGGTDVAWMNDDSVQVCEYWKVNGEKKKFLRLSTPEGPMELFLDEIAKKLGAKTVKLKDKVLWVDGSEIQVLREKQAEVPHVYQYITNGLEILKTHDWTKSTGGTMIPLIVVTGLRKYEKGKLVIESATRKMRAGQLLYDYATTCELEVLGMAPKSHWVAAAGQTEEFPEWDDANRDPVSVLRYLHKLPDMSGDEILPAPERVDYEPPIQALEFARQSALIAVQQAAGMFSVERQTKEGQSGKAIDKLNQEQDIGNYHFADYLDLAIQHEGRIKNEILRHIEDTEAVRGVRSEDDKYSRVPIVPKVDPETDELVEHPYRKGRDHDVSVRAGPSNDTQWDKASDFLDLLAQNPQYAPIVMPEVVQMKRLGPMGKKLAEMFEKLREKMFPDVVQKEGEQPQQEQIPPEIVQALTEQLNAAMAKLNSKQDELAAKVQMNQADNATKLAIANMDAKVQTQADQVALFMQKMDQILEVTMQGRQLDQSAAQTTEQTALQREQMAQQGMQPQP